MKAKISLDGYHLPVVQFESKYSSVNISGTIYRKVKELWCNNILNDSRKVQLDVLYSHLPDKKFPVMQVELDVKVIVIPNYNGYTTAYIMQDEQSYVGKTSSMSLEEFDVWESTHKATWKNDEWVYVPI